MTVAAKEILGLDNQELMTLLKDWGEPKYRAKQLFQAIYQQRVTSIDGITVFPKPLRE